MHNNPIPSMCIPLYPLAPSPPPYICPSWISLEHNSDIRQPTFSSQRGGLDSPSMMLKDGQYHYLFLLSLLPNQLFRFSGWGFASDLVISTTDFWGTEFPLVIPRFIGVRGVLSLDCGGGPWFWLPIGSLLFPFCSLMPLPGGRYWGLFPNPLNPYVSMGSFGGCGSAWIPSTELFRLLGSVEYPAASAELPDAVVTVSYERCWPPGAVYTPLLKCGSDAVRGYRDLFGVYPLPAPWLSVV